MTSMSLSVDKAGDLKIGARKCRLYKKSEIVKVAKKHGIVTDKKTVKELCGSLKKKITPKKKVLTKDEAAVRIFKMKGLTAMNRFQLTNKMSAGRESPTRVLRIARELARLR